ncbi:hypothetical protein PHISCL_03876 [Aspergillus sclerotialis]|uniref:Uncharacterized protein n=1 Tax=Aspergillus sclerotialis TaxID=2070753 RepID=A0A3A3A362_9EURO|nr:hypothetical protein PHISCL_03876 [Aspergillus sclerotialis]
MVESGGLSLLTCKSQLVEIGEIIVSEKDAAIHDASTGENIIFKCVGIGIMDLVVGETLLELSSELSIGTEVEGFGFMLKLCGEGIYKYRK